MYMYKKASRRSLTWTQHHPQQTYSNLLFFQAVATFLTYII